MARRLDADVLVILDGDGQHNPEEIPVLVKGIGRGRADVIVGTRFHATQESHIPWYRNLGIQLITRLTNLGMVTKVSDAQSGFRAFSSKAIEALNINELDMGASTELLLESSANGLTIEEVPISVRYDLDGSSKNPLSHGLGILAQLFRYVENKHPLMVFSLPGAIVFISGFLQGLQILVNYESGAPAPLGLALISIVFILIGTLSIYTGMILHAISGRGLPIGSKKQSPVDGQTVVENVG